MARGQGWLDPNLGVASGLTLDLAQSVDWATGRRRTVSTSSAFSSTLWELGGGGLQEG